MPIHKNLQRQVEKIYGENTPHTNEFHNLLARISETYEGRDSEYQLLERSLEISSKELTELNEALRNEKAVIEQIVEERTQELSQERSKLEKIAQNMETGAILLDRDKNVAFVNITATTFIGLTEPLFANILPALYEKFAPCPLEEYVRCCVAGVEDELKDVEVEKSWYEFKFQVLANENGYLIWIKDVTSEELLERSKNELLAIASHQLRSPLTVVKGNTEMLLDETFGPLTDEQNKIVKQSAQSNENMIALINQMLDITKISQQGLGIKIELLPVEEILEQVIADLQPYAENHAVSLQSSVHEESGICIHADRPRLYQVFQNLIENAVNYSNPESSDAVVTVVTRTQDDNIIIEIADSGIGIPESEQSKLFARFYRASNAIKFAPNGSGLGLYIVKSIIQIFDGTINFSSVQNKGTTFTITFPIK